MPQHKPSSPKRRLPALPTRAPKKARNSTSRLGSATTREPTSRSWLSPLMKRSRNHSADLLHQLWCGGRRSEHITLALGDCPFVRPFADLRTPRRSARRPLPNKGPEKNPGLGSVRVLLVVNGTVSSKN